MVHQGCFHLNLFICKNGFFHKFPIIFIFCCGKNQSFTHLGALEQLSTLSHVKDTLYN